MPEEKQTEQSLPDSVQEPVPQQEPEIKVGYIVALNTSGNLIFEIIGEEKTTLEVLGLHQYASERIRILSNRTTGGGDILAQQTGAAVLDLNKKLDKLLQIVTPKNKL